MDTSIRPFLAEVPERALDDLRQRLSQLDLLADAG